MNEFLFSIFPILFSERPLFVTSDGYRQMVMAVLPYIHLHSGDTRSLELEPATYKEKTDMALASLKRVLSEGDTTKAISVTNEFDSRELPADSIAYHRVFGFITGGSRWLFSSMQLERDLLAAEANPQVSAHLLHVNSAGGEAWYLDRLSETLRGCQKPVFTVCEGYMASAAYYIGCHGRKVYAVTLNDIIGSIGAMTSFHDYEGYFKQLGIRLVEAKATLSDLKNKMAEDLVAGKPGQYVEEILNPLMDQFVAEVKSERSRLAEMDKDHPVLRGHVYYSPRAEELGLIDGRHTVAEALAELSALVSSNREMNYILNSI